MWMAIDDEVRAGPAIRRVLVAMVGAYGENNVDWNAQGRGHAPRLGRGMWRPHEGFEGPNLFGAWFGHVAL